MAQEAVSAGDAQQAAWETIVTDWSSDKQTFRVPWGKAMMWIFLLSDTFIFTCFLTGYMNVRMSTRARCSASRYSASACRCS